MATRACGRSIYTAKGAKRSRGSEETRNGRRSTDTWLQTADFRVFVRSWNDKPTGWYRAFRKQPHGSIQLPDREIPVRARPTRSERLQQAVSQAYAEKYPTKASQKWVTGFAEPIRAQTTLELMPIE